MSNGPQYNRHGIRIFGPEPQQCIWPRCPHAALVKLRTNMCRGHTRIIAERYEQYLAEQEAELQARIAADPDMFPLPEKTEVVYYVQVGGHIKIGWTSQLDKRMRAYPPNTTLLAVHPGTRADERKLHQRFAVHRSHGQEWYPLVPVILDHIKRVIAEHGDPPAITFGARPVEVPRPHQTKTQLRANYGPMLRG